MNNLNKKIFRELFQLKFQAITISLVVASGVAIFIASLISYDSLWTARDKFYTNYYFSQGFVSLKRAPNSVNRRLEKIQGIGIVKTRIIQEGTIDFKEEILPTSARFVSLTKGINEIALTSGRFPVTDQEVIVSESFAKANKLNPGDKITTILYGVRKSFVMVGTGLSPEYVYIFRVSNPMPDDKHYGVFWMNREALEKAFRMEGAFNDAVFTFIPGANTRSVLKEVDNVLENYGGFGSYDRDKLPSYSFLRDEFKQLKTTAFMIPVIFLGVAAFLLHIVSTRLVSKEREQIATLKALGYDNWTIALHYLKFISVISSLGSIVGIFLGIYLGELMTNLYGMYYRFPDLRALFNPLHSVLGYIVGVGSGAVGALFAIRQVLKLEPASAMRPPVPESFKKNFLERTGLLLSTTTKMIIRNLFQRPVRTALASLGISSAVMIMVIGTFSQDAIDTMLDVQFNLLQRESMNVSFLNPVTTHSILEISSQRGVVHTEGYRIVPVRIRAGHKSKELVLQGIPHNAELRRLIGKNRQIITPTTTGILLNSVVAEKMGIVKGQNIELEVLEGNRRKIRLKVEGTIDEILGQGAYMDRESVSRILGEGNSVNLIAMRIDSNEEENLLRKLKTFPKIAGVSTRSGTLKVFNDIMERTTLGTALILLIFSSVIAIGVVYNTAMISLSERAFELGSLRILGFTNSEVFQILAGELIFETFFALPLGCALGYLFAYLMLQTVDTEGFTFPLSISMKTYGYALLMTIGTLIISFFIIYRKVKSMDLISVLKIRE